MNENNSNYKQNCENGDRAYYTQKINMYNSDDKITIIKN